MGTQDLHDNVIILRHRGAARNNYSDELRARRDFLKRIFNLLTHRGTWRPGHGEEFLHIFYADVGVHAEVDSDALFEVEGAPAGLVFHDLGGSEYVAALSATHFEE